MKTHIRKNRDIYFIDVEGCLDFVGVDNLKSFCLYKNFKTKKLIFNLKSLSFVGSKGVETFSDTLHSINKNNNIKICCASSEFEKVFDKDGLKMSFCQSETEAIKSFNQAKLVFKD